MDDLHEAIKENEELHDRIRQLEREVVGLQEERDRAQTALAASASAVPKALAPAVARESEHHAESSCRGVQIMKDMKNILTTDALRTKVAHGEKALAELREALDRERAQAKAQQEELAQLRLGIAAAQGEAEKARAEADLLRSKVKAGQEDMEVERTALRGEIQGLREQLEEAHFSMAPAGGRGLGEEPNSLRFSGAEDSLARQLTGLGGLVASDDSGSEAGEGERGGAAAPGGAPKERVQELQRECADLREQLKDAKKAQTECRQLRERLSAAEEKARRIQSASDDAELSFEIQTERHRLECKQLQERLRQLQAAAAAEQPPPRRASAGAAEGPAVEEAALRECAQLRKQVAALEAEREELRRRAAEGPAPAPEGGGSRPPAEGAEPRQRAEANAWEASLQPEASQLQQELAPEQTHVSEETAASEAAKQDLCPWPRDPAVVAAAEREDVDLLREELEEAQGEQASAAHELEARCGRLQQQLAELQQLLPSLLAAQEPSLAAGQMPDASRCPAAGHGPGLGGTGEAGQLPNPWEGLGRAQDGAALLQEGLAAAREAQQASAELGRRLAAAEAAQGEARLRRKVTCPEMELECEGGNRCLDRSMDSFLGSFSCFSGRARRRPSAPSTHGNRSSEAPPPAAPPRSSVNGQGRSLRASARRARLRER